MLATGETCLLAFWQLVRWTRPSQWMEYKEPQFKPWLTESSEVLSKRSGQQNGWCECSWAMGVGCCANVENATSSTDAQMTAGMQASTFSGEKMKTKKTSTVVQQLRLCAPNEEDLGSVPGQGTRPHMLQRPCAMQPKIPCVAIKTWYSQINNFLFFFQKRQGKCRWTGDWKETPLQRQTVMESYGIQGLSWHHRCKNSWCSYTSSPFGKPFTHRLGSVNLPGASVDDSEDSDNTPQDVSKMTPGLGTSGEVKKGACSFR